MQPIAYFAVRSLLGWLQYVERGDRAFISSTALLVATGAAHCWAVVYALFIAIHTRAMRFDGYHEGYTEHLPVWVSTTETLAVASMGIWWAAGFLTAAIRIIDDDVNELPVESRDVNVGFFFRLIRSQRLHDVLAFAHTLSCVGLFVSTILLCIAMALMKGDVTACEICLCVVSVCFALPHAAMAHAQLPLAHPKKKEDDSSKVELLPGAEAAAQEAAALGPQLAVILALADSPGHAFLWQNVVYFISAVGFVVAVWACATAPAKRSTAAIPPGPGEITVCMLMDAAACMSLVVCFPHLNTWHLWALAALLCCAFVVIWLDSWRDVLVDLLEPLMVVRSETDRALGFRQREGLRTVSRVTTSVCAAVALWDILLHPLPEGLLEPPPEHVAGDALPALWDQSSMLLLRWLPEPVEAPGKEALLASVAEALEVDKAMVAAQVFSPIHRMLLFSAKSGEARGSPAHARWRAATLAPTGGLAEVIDAGFPATLNVTLCLHAHTVLEHAKAENVNPVMPADFNDIVGTARDAQKAYNTACEWWWENGG